MNTGRHIRFFRNGRNQAIRIPREFEVDAEEAIIRRENDRLVSSRSEEKGCLPRFRRCTRWMVTYPISIRGYCLWMMLSCEPDALLFAGHQHPVRPGALPAGQDCTTHRTRGGKGRLHLDDRSK